ncbi:MAG: sulfotransferase domain-containing protein [Luteolibacter sp.]
MNQTYLHERTKRDFLNFSILRHTRCDGYLVTMKHSGTHWLRFMISLALAKTHDLPTPESVECQDYTYMPQAKSTYRHIPRIVASHQIPSPILTVPLIQHMFPIPDCVLLVRDPRLSLVACYHKHKHEHSLSFSEFLRVRRDLLLKHTGKRKFVNDIWWLSRFINSWSRLMEQQPSKIELIRYESLRADPRANLIKVLNKFSIPTPPEDVLDWCIQQSSKENMAIKEEKNSQIRVVRKDEENPLAIFSSEDKEFFLQSFERNCRSSFGYDLHSGW